MVATGSTKSGAHAPQSGGGGIAPLVRLNNGRYMPQLALGTFLGWNADGPVTSKDNDLAQAVEWALDHGYRHFDTAAIYQTEDQVGLGVGKKIEDGTVSRDEVFVTTKLWNDKHEREQVVPALKESLAKLKLDYVDLYLVHWPVSYTETQVPQNIDIVDTWRGMEEAHRLGLAKSIGLSNYNEEQFQRIIEHADVKPAVLEVEVNPNFTNEPLVQAALDSGLQVMAYSPFGSLVPIRSQADSPPPKIDDPALVTIGKKYGKTTPQVVLRYLIERGLVPIPKSINKERIEQNINIFDFQLTDEEVQTIAKFNCDKRIVLPSFWQSHPEYPFEKLDAPIHNPF